MPLAKPLVFSAAGMKSPPYIGRPRNKINGNVYAAMPWSREAGMQRPIAARHVWIFNKKLKRAVLYARLP